MDFFGNKRVPDPNPGNMSTYSVGKKRYGGGRTAPNVGPVSDILGYKERDRKKEAQGQRSALMRRMKAQDSGSYMRPDNLRWR